MINLDPQQLAAVTTKSRRALVVAGAGSGKTRVLTERIAHLIEQEHASPYEILCWTFTRKAAGEMRERLVNRIGVQAHQITIIFVADAQQIISNWCNGPDGPTAILIAAADALRLRGRRKR